MGMKNIEGYGQFRKMDKRSVLGSLKATGSRDPDVLLLQKQKLLAPNKSSRFAGLCLAVLARCSRSPLSAPFSVFRFCSSERGSGGSEDGTSRWWNRHMTSM